MSKHSDKNTNSDKPAYHHGDLRSALLAAGEEILESHGLQGFTLRQCAKRAGVSHAAPAHHFGNVTGLLTAIAVRGFTRLVGILRERLVAAGDDLDAQFVATSAAYTEFAEQYPEHFRIMFRCDLLDMTSEPLSTAAAETFTELTNVIRRQRGEGEIHASTVAEQPDACGLLSDILIGWCFVHGYAHLHLEKQLLLIPIDLQQAMRTQTAQRLSELIRSDSA